MSCLAPSPTPDTAAASAQAPRNRLLAGLPAAELARLAPHLTCVALPHARQLYDVGEPILSVYFPLTALVSLMIVLEDGGEIEMAAVGHEGLCGLPVALGSPTDGHRAVVQIAGDALRMDASTFVALLPDLPEMRNILGRYALVALTQAGQSAACNGVHPIGERCARWLLEARDRVGADTFQLTQDFLAAMLGVRRAGVTVAAGLLQHAGIITYRRGRVTILDEERLEAASCECYAFITAETNRLLRDSAGPPPA